MATIPTAADVQIAATLTEVIKKQSVDVPPTKAAAVAEQIIAEVKKNDTITIAPVKSTWLSKINWTQGAGVVFTIAALFGFDIPPEVRANIIAAIVAIMAVVTWVLKTFFSNSVTPQSAQV